MDALVSHIDEICNDGYVCWITISNADDRRTQIKCILKAEAFQAYEIDDLFIWDEDNKTALPVPPNGTSEEIAALPPVGSERDEVLKQWAEINKCRNEAARAEIEANLDKLQQEYEDILKHLDLGLNERD